MRTRTVHFLPLEALPARYTEQMLSWVTSALHRFEFRGAIDRFLTYQPVSDSASITCGQFLDNYTSLIYKQEQLAMLIRSMRAGHVRSGDVVLVGDVWYPGLESVRMVADLMGIQLTIAGWHYAGVYDPHDYYSKQLGPWSRLFENLIVGSVLDHICCGSEFHRNFVLRNIPVDPNKVHALGLAWNATDVSKYKSNNPKQKIVVFPHRLAPEKAPKHFIEAASLLKSRYPDWRFVFSITSAPPDDLVEFNQQLDAPCEFKLHEDADGLSAKEHYYALLDAASIVYSSGYQETFGYAIHEGMALGCVVCLPDRACYPESVSYDSRFLYSPEKDPWGVLALDRLMSSEMVDLAPYTAIFNTSIDDFLTQIL